MTDSSLSLHDSQIVKPVVVKLVDNLWIVFSHVGPKGIACATKGILTEIVISEARTMSQQGLVKLACIACANAHLAKKDVVRSGLLRKEEARRL